MKGTTMHAVRSSVAIALLAAASFTTAHPAGASTVLLAPTQVTVPVGTSYFPGVNGGSMPAGVNEAIISIDTASMPTSNSMTVHTQFQYSGDPTWYDSAVAGPFSGGVHPTMHSQTNTVISMGVTVGASPYPTNYRFQVDNGPTPSTVTVSASTQ